MRKKVFKKLEKNYDPWELGRIQVGNTTRVFLNFFCFKNRISHQSAATRKYNCGKEEWGFVGCCWICDGSHKFINFFLRRVVNHNIDFQIVSSKLVLKLMYRLWTSEKHLLGGLHP